jgi:hypothetical protein
LIGPEGHKDCGKLAVSVHLRFSPLEIGTRVPLRAGTCAEHPGIEVKHMFKAILVTPEVSAKIDKQIRYQKRKRARQEAKAGVVRKG